MDTERLGEEDSNLPLPGASRQQEHRAPTFAIKQTDFGIKPFSGGPAGTVKVGDRVTFNIDAVAVREH